MATEENVGTPIEGEVAPEKQADQQQAPRDFEAEARRNGWYPESEHTPDKKRPAVFLDAETFVKRGEELTPLIRKENRKLQELVDRQQKDFTTRLERMEKVAKANFDREVSAYQREIERLKGEQVKAVEAGDVKAFQKIDAAISKVPIPEEPEVGAGTVTEPNLEEQFAADNPWYGADKKLTAYAIGVSQEIAREYFERHKVELPMAENLKQTLEDVKATFPAKFAKSNGNGHAAVDSGGDFAAPSPKSDPLSKLPAEARNQAKLDMAAYPKAYPNAAAWIKVYEGKV